MYLESFVLPVAEEERMLAERAAHNGGVFGYIDNPYPCGIFTKKQLGEIFFSQTTIFYGGNGSGKSTLLNLIAQRLELKRIAPFNSGEMFAIYAENCSYETGSDDAGFPYRIPDGSQIITSDDIFDYMLTVRTKNDMINAGKEETREEWGKLRHGETLRFSSLDDYEDLRKQILARRKTVSRRQFVRTTLGEETPLNSNGETALHYFIANLREDTLYCLDEPENSMSPKMQLELVGILEEMARYCGCQFIIATHSPFLLALDKARIYDLDTDPVCVRNWWELENTRIYYDFFQKYRNLFEW